MRQDHLLELIRNGENSGVEFKREDIRREQLAKEVVALANLQGGHILIGVADDGIVTGVTRPDLETWVMDTVFGRYVHPMLLPYYEEIPLDTGIKVAVLSFPQGVSKPYVVRHNNREEVYIRVGSVSRLATREQQARLYALGGLLHTEAMPVPGATPSALDRSRLENYLRDVLHDPDVPESEPEWIQRLTALGFLAVLPDHRPTCTIAGLTLFGASPRRYLRQAGLRVMVFDGQDKDYRAILDRTIDAPMVGRWMPGGAPQPTLVDEGLIEKFIALIGPFISSESDTIDDGLRRSRHWDYPLPVIREALINALAHRDWTRAVDIEVSVYADRMEIVSPGALPNSMTVEKMLAGQRVPRNPLIVEVLRDYTYVDARGMGVRTKIVPLMKAHNNAAPVFEATEDELKTILPKRLPDTAKNKGSLKGHDDPINDPISDESLLLLKALQTTPSATYTELAVRLNISTATVKRHISQLKTLGRLQRVGSRKTGYWNVLP